MEVTNQIKLKFHGVDFPVINLNSDEPFSNPDEKSIDVNVIPKVFYPNENLSFFKIVQEIRIKSEKSFDLFILAVGTFELVDLTDEITKKHFVNSNAPAIMFPYIRSFVSTLTSNIGNVTGTLIIPTQFFKGELEEISALPQV